MGKLEPKTEEEVWRDCVIKDFKMLQTRIDRLCAGFMALTILVGVVFIGIVVR